MLCIVRSQDVKGKGFEVWVWEHNRNLGNTMALFGEVLLISVFLYFPSFCITYHLKFLFLIDNFAILKPDFFHCLI